MSNLKFNNEGDYYGYSKMGESYYIESIDGEMLIGDKLPRTEEAAQQYCRCANIAFSQAMKVIKSQLNKNLGSVFE